MRTFGAYDPQQLNRYAYTRNNPYKYVDEDGREAELRGYSVNVGFLVFLNYETGNVFINGMYSGQYNTIGVGIGSFGASYNPAVRTYMPNANSKKDIEGTSHSYGADIVLGRFSTGGKFSLPLKGEYEDKEGYDFSQPSFAGEVGIGLGLRMGGFIMEEKTTVSETTNAQEWVPSLDPINKNDNDFKQNIPLAPQTSQPEQQKATNTQNQQNTRTNTLFYRLFSKVKTILKVK